MYREKRCPKSSTERNALLITSQIMPRKEECVRGMGQGSSDAAAKVVQIMLRKEECAKDMGQRRNDMNALLMGAQI